MEISSCPTTPLDNERTLRRSKDVLDVLETSYVCSLRPVSSGSIVLSKNVEIKRYS